MKIFVTGATGFIGSAVVRELLEAGHHVVGLARSEAGASRLRAAGAQVHRGSLEDLGSLAAGAAASDAVVHLAFTHTFPGVILAPFRDERAIDALGAALEGSGRPLVVAGAVLGVRTGQVLTEDYRPDYARVPRRSERAVMRWADRGVRAAVVRLAPTVHGQGDQGFVRGLVGAARKGRAVYVGDGSQRWAAVHRLDAARLFRLAVEGGAAGGVYHGVAEQLAFGDLAGALGRRLGVPAVSRSPLGALASLGFLGLLANVDGPATSTLTRQALGWSPSHPSLLEDLESGVYDQ